MNKTAVDIAEMLRQRTMIGADTAGMPMAPQVPEGNIAATAEYLRKAEIARLMKPAYQLAEQARQAQAARIRAKMFGIPEGQAKVNPMAKGLSDLLAMSLYKERMLPYLRSMEAEIEARGVSPWKDRDPGWTTPPPGVWKQPVSRQVKARNEAIANAEMKKLRTYLQELDFAVGNTGGVRGYGTFGRKHDEALDAATEIQ